MCCLPYYLVFVAVATSMTIPRSGTKVAGFPVTLPIILYVALLMLAAFRPLSRMRLKVFSGDAAVDVIMLGVLTFMIGALVSLAVGAIRGAAVTDILVQAVALAGFVPMFFLIRRYVDDAGTFWLMIRVIVFSLAAVSIYGICQSLFGHYTTMIPGLTIAYSDAQSPDAFALKNNLTAVGLKVVSTFQNGNLFGNYLALLIPIPAVLFHSSRGARRWLYLLLLVVTIANLLLSLSRGAIVAGMVSLGVLSMLLPRARDLRITFLVIVALGGGMVYLLQLGERLLSLDLTLGGRTTMYEDIAAAYGNLPPLGLFLAVLVGLGFGGALGPFGASQQLVESSTMLVGMKMGVVSLASLCVVVIGIFSLAFRRYRLDGSLEGQIGCALAAGLVGASVQLAIDSVIMMPPTAMNLWIIAGLALAAGSIARTKNNRMESAT